MKDNISQYFSSRCYPSYIVTLKLIRKNQRNLSQVKNIYQYMDHFSS